MNLFIRCYLFIFIKIFIIIYIGINIYKNFVYPTAVI